jgi:hypothetical protein
MFKIRQNETQAYLGDDGALAVDLSPHTGVDLRSQQGGSTMSSLSSLSMPPTQPALVKDLSSSDKKRKQDTYGRMRDEEL